MLKLSWKNYKYHFKNYLPAVLVLGMGVGMIHLVLHLRDQFEKNLNGNLNGIETVIGAKGSPLQLVLSNVYHIDHPTGNIPLNDALKYSKFPVVKKALPLSYGDNHQGFRVLGTTMDYIEHFDAQLVTGRYFTKPLEVVLGAHAASEMNAKLGDQFSSTHGHGHAGHVHEEFKYEVVGILAKTGKVVDNLILTPIASVWITHNEQNLTNSFDEKSFEKAAQLNGTNYQPQKIIPDSTENRMITALLVSFKGSAGFLLSGQINSGTQLMAANPGTEINQLFEMLGFGLNTIKYIAYLILFISMTTLTLTLVRLFDQRKYELSLMRVFGSSKKSLISLTLLECLWIVLSGFVLGVVLSSIAKLMVNHQISSDFKHQLDFIDLGPNELLLFLICCVCGMISVVIPLVKTYRIDISNTLADEK